MYATPRIEARPAHAYAAIRMQVPLPFGKVLQPAWSKVEGWLKAQGLTHGPAIIRYNTTDMSAKLDIEVGYTLDEAIPGSGEIICSMLPAGRYATLPYIGPYRGKGMYKTNVAMMEWAAANKIAWDISPRSGEEFWASRVEWYFSDPDVEKDPKKYKSELTIMVAEG